MDVLLQVEAVVVIIIIIIIIIIVVVAGDKEADRLARLVDDKGPRPSLCHISEVGFAFTRGTGLEKEKGGA